MITNIATGNGLLSRLDDTCRRAYYDLIGVAQISASAARRLMVEVSCNTNMSFASRLYHHR